MKRQKKQAKGKKAKEEMTLVDCYYIPSEIAPQFRLLREHCACEVELYLQRYFSEVKRESREDIGEVIVAYDETHHLKGEMALSPTDISKLEKEISAERLDKYLETFYQFPM